MSQISQILAQVFKTGNYEPWKEGCNPLAFTGVSTAYKSQGERWMVPVIEHGIVATYEETYEDASLISGAFKAIRLRNEIDGDILYILGTEVQWINFTNGCCGTTPQMDSVTIPSPLIDQSPCCDSTVTATVCNYVYESASAPIVTGQKLTVTGDNAGVAFTPSAPGGGFSTVAATLAWVQANWGAYGTWTAEGTSGIKLTSTTIVKGNFKIDFLSQSWCMVIVAAETFDTVKNLGSSTALNKTLTVSTAAQMIIDLKDYFADGVLTAFAPTKVNYVGKGVPGGILTGSTAVRSFTVGACS